MSPAQSHITELGPTELQILLACNAAASTDYCGYCGGDVTSPCPANYSCMTSGDACVCSYPLDPNGACCASKDLCGYCSGSVSSCPTNEVCQPGHDSCYCSTSTDACGVCGGGCSGGGGPYTSPGNGTTIPTVSTTYSCNCGTSPIGGPSGTGCGYFGESGSNAACAPDSQCQSNSCSCTGSYSLSGDACVSVRQQRHVRADMLLAGLTVAAMFRGSDGGGLFIWRFMFRRPVFLR